MLVLLVERFQASLFRRPLQKRDILYLASAGVAAVVGVFPQLTSWKLQYGTWLANSVAYEWRIIPPYFIHVLFSRRHGLFFWSPGLLLALAGLVYALSKREREPGWYLLILGGVTFMYGNWRIYWLGVSFGMRGYIDFLPIFATGFASILVWLRSIQPARWRAIAMELLAVFLMLNVHLAIAYRCGAVWSDGPLYWLDTVSQGKAYKARLAYEWNVITDFGPGSRFSLLRIPSNAGRDTNPSAHPNPIR